MESSRIVGKDPMHPMFPDIMFTKKKKKKKKLIPPRNTPLQVPGKQVWPYENQSTLSTKSMAPTTYFWKMQSWDSDIINCWWPFKEFVWPPFHRQSFSPFAHCEQLL